MLSEQEQARIAVRTMLRAQGMRATAARIAVLVTLYERKGPMTHEQVMSVLPSGLYDKASVWRILADLADTDLLRRMDLGDRVWRYELQDAHRSVADNHPHFLCESCGLVSCLPPLNIQPQSGTLPAVFLNADFRVQIMGTCGDCKAS